MGKIIGQRFYGLHMVEGLAEYRTPDKKPNRMLILENAIKNMDPTFEGRPVYVQHVDEIDLNNADGYVIKSFFNKADGKHWAEFLVTTENGLQKIKDGWKLSNAYTPTSKGRAGVWHGADYDEEVQAGIYDHLAIVDNPRYSESVILDPDQFKKYNADKEAELTKLQNSKEEKSMFKLFKRTPVENAIDLKDTEVTLPKSGKTLTLEKLVNDMDAVLNMQGYASDDHMVKCGEEEMSVKDLAKNYLKMKKNMEAVEEADGKDKEKGAEMEAEMDKKKNADDAAAKAKADADLAEFEKLKNAHLRGSKAAAEVIDLPEDMVNRGKQLYGSK